MEEYVDEEYKFLNAPRLTTKEWELVLKNEIEKHNGFDFLGKVLIEMYKLEDHTIFCKDFEQEHGYGGLSLRVGEFRNRIAKVIPNYVPQLREDTDKDRAWNIPFTSSEELNIKNPGKFSWVLRKELIEAMELLIPSIKEYRNTYSNQYPPIEYYDPKLIEKEVQYVDVSEILASTKKIEYEYKSTKRLPKKQDYIKKNIRNKIIGDSGEKKVRLIEKEYLKKHGKNDLARKVKIVDSDALGYDVLSFDLDGNEKHIEVKTSTSSNVSFYITDYEVQTLLHDDSYELYYLCCTKEEKIKIIKFSNEQLREKVVKELLKPVQYLVEI